MELPRVVQEWVATWDGGLDIERYMSLWTDDVEFADAQSGRSGTGRDALQEFAQAFALLRDIEMTVRSSAQDGDDIFLEIEMRGSAPDGTPVSSVGTAIFTVAGSKLSSVRSYIIRQNVDL